MYVLFSISRKLTSHFSHALKFNTEIVHIFRKEFLNHNVGHFR